VGETVAGGCCDGELCRESEVRLLAKLLRSEESESSLRTPALSRGLLCGIDCEFGEVGERGIRSLLSFLVDEGGGLWRVGFSFLDGGVAECRILEVGVTCLERVGGVAGCEDNGPPPGVGGRTIDSGECGEESAEARGYRSLCRSTLTGVSAIWYRPFVDLRIVVMFVVPLLHVLKVKAGCTIAYRSS